MGVKKQSQRTCGLEKKEIITFLKKQKPFLKKEFGITKVALFGSYARDEATPKSDIDILIEMKVPDFRERLRFGRYLEAHFNKKIDVLYFSSVRKFIMRSIQEDIVYA